MKKLFISISLLVIPSFVHVNIAKAEDTTNKEVLKKQTKTLELVKGNISHIFVESGIKDIVVGNPSISSFNVIPKQNKLVVLTGEKLGSTNLIITTSKGKETYDLTVTKTEKTESSDDKKIVLEVNKVKEMEFKRGVSFFAVGEPAKVKLTMIPKQNKKILLTGMNKGKTNLLVLENGEKEPKSYSVNVR